MTGFPVPSTVTYTTGPRTSRPMASPITTACHAHDRRAERAAIIAPITLAVEWTKVPTAAIVADGARRTQGRESLRETSPYQ
jgi:hypothetical protein